jgi:hypothetical protein
MKIKIVLLSTLISWCTSAFLNPLLAQDQKTGGSVYTLKINDPRAVYFTREKFDVSTDGTGDNATALQAAIDLVQKQSGNGIVFIPEGTYRLGKAVYLWTGIRLIGYGATRPVFKLGDKTPGYQEGENKYMIHFCQTRSTENLGSIQPGAWRTPDFIDGTFTTFYSGVSNINFEIGNGNPAAIAVRYHIAQVCALENIDFNIGNGRGAVEEMGNIIENCTFRGGEFGIKTGTSAPGWQCMVLDCTFEGQREASIITNGARMLVIRDKFNNTPTGILVPEIERLYVKDTWFENIKNSAIVINNFVPPDLQVNLDNIKLSNVPYSIRFNGRTQGWTKNEVKMDFEAPSPIYVIKNFSHGIIIENSGENTVSRKFTTINEQLPIETLGEFSSKDISALPAQNSWVSILDLGAKGDGTTDCTDIFEKAIAKYDAIYIPMGRYCISRTLTLRSQTTLIGLHPSMTKLVLKDKTTGFTDPENCKSLIIAPENGSNGITGLGFDFGTNPGVIGIKWMANIHSFINDALFNGRGNVRGEGQMHSIWVTNGGGGTFKNFWAPDTRTKCPLFISNTKTPGKIYEISIEHHKDIEVKFENVENWSIYALQLEEDKGSEKALGIYMKDCRNILFASLISHRTTGVWEPYYTAIQIRNSNNIIIQGSEIRGAVFPFDNALFDERTGLVIHDRFFTKLVIK